MDSKMRGWKFDENWRVPQSHSIFLPLTPNFLLITKGKNSKMVRRPDPCHLGQLIKDNVTNNVTGPTSSPSGWIYQGRHNITSGVFLPKIHHPDLITRKHQTNPNQVTVYKINGLYSSKNVKVKERKRSGEDKEWPSRCSSPKGTKETWQLKGTCSWGKHVFGEGTQFEIGLRS